MISGIDGKQSHATTKSCLAKMIGLIRKAFCTNAATFAPQEISGCCYRAESYLIRGSLGEILWTAREMPVLFTSFHGAAPMHRQMLTLVSEYCRSMQLLEHFLCQWRRFSAAGDFRWLILPVMGTSRVSNSELTKLIPSQAVWPSTSAATPLEQARKRWPREHGKAQKTSAPNPASCRP